MIYSAWRRLRTDFTGVFNTFTRGRGRAGTHLFTLVVSDRTQRSGMKWHESGEDIRKRFYTQRVVELWNRLPRKWSNTSLTEFKKQKMVMAPA